MAKCFLDEDYMCETYRYRGETEIWEFQFIKCFEKKNYGFICSSGVQVASANISWYEAYQRCIDNGSELSRDIDDLPKKETNASLWVSLLRRPSLIWGKEIMTASLGSVLGGVLVCIVVVAAIKHKRYIYDEIIDTLPLINYLPTWCLTDGGNCSYNDPNIAEPKTRKSSSSNFSVFAVETKKTLVSVMQNTQIQPDKYALSRQKTSYCNSLLIFYDICMQTT
ncbi:uncharacterized protein LOC134726573 [Mytilus trossulus]|uniref:uncharacterized protein LOC134726573 n=1 Tax=Mytilus trossulus TaxID=6551 RepID=UPI0030069CD0